MKPETIRLKEAPSYTSGSAARLVGGIAIVLTAVCLADWPQYRGVHHNGISTEAVSKWPSDGPRALWRVPAPDGFSSFTTGNGRVFTIVGRNIDGAPREVCVALDESTGKELWAAPVGVAKYDGGGDSGTENNKGGDGPRSTPSVDGDRVYVLSGQLYLACLESATGKEIWSKNLLKDYAGRNITWQNAASPLVEGDLVFVAGGGPGQSLLAFNKNNGQLAWKGQDDKMTHATPIATTILDKRQIIFFTQSGLVSVTPESGEVLWRYTFPYKVSTAASPVVAGQIVYCAAGYGVGAGAVKVTKSGDSFSAKELWRSTGNQPVANHWSTPVYRDGHLYGMFSFKEYGSGPLKCVEVATGKVVWEKPGFGAGNVILAGNRVLALADDGQLILVEANPKEYQEVARAKVVSGKCWSTPIVSNGRIYLRSTKEAVCLQSSQPTAKN
jgi:outer membrane protein assembly factor BamB